MTKETIKGKDMTSFTGPVDTGDAHANRKADRKKLGDMEPDTSVADKSTKGTELPGVANLGEEVKKLFSGVEGLTEDFIDKAAILFEAAISDKVNTIKESFQVKYDEEIANVYESLAEEIDEKLNGYLNTLAENYFEENKMVIESQFDAEIASSITESIAEIVTCAGLKMPEEQIDVAESLAEENEQLQAQYNNVFEENVKLNNTINYYKLQEAFNSQTEGLSEATKDKLSKLVENMKFDNVDDFNKKFETIKESFSENKPDVNSTKSNLTEESTFRAEATESSNPIERLAKTLNSASYI